MAATGTTQTTTTAASTASPAAGASTSTAEQSTTKGNQESQSGDAFDRALAGDLERAFKAETETGKEQANRGTAADGKVKGQEVNGQESAAEAAGEATGGEETGEIEGGAEEGGTETGDDEGESTEELPEEVDPEKPPKGMENVPKKVWQRFNKVTKENKELKAQVAQGGIRITPTKASPLADVEDLKSLDQRITGAKAIRDAVKANPGYLTDGARIKRTDGSTIELTAEQVKARLAKAEAEIEAHPDVKARLSERSQTKPWEAAAKVAPDLFKKGSEDHNFLLAVLKEVPQLKQLPDWEVVVACAARGYRQFMEEQSGAASYVRHEMKDGKMILPKQQQQNKHAATADPNKVRPKTPGTGKPPLNGRGQTRVTAAERLAALPATATHDQRLDAALEAAFA